MFRKEFKIKTNIKLKKSDRNKFIQEVTNSYGLSENHVSVLFGKSDLYKIKIDCCTDEYSTLYVVEKNPLFFEKCEVIIPTLYTLWIAPDILPSFLIYEETIQYLKRGSDLMVAGIIVEKPVTDRSYGRFKKNELMTIKTDTNNAPICVGMTNMDSYDMFMCAGRGKGVTVVHIEGDYLWAYGDKASRPIISYEPVVDDAGEVTVDDFNNNDEPPSNDPTSNELPVEFIQNELEEMDLEDSLIEPEPELNMDDVLRNCFLHALKFSVEVKELPMNFNIFYSNHVLKYCPSNVEFDIKKTTYKKFSIFMRKMEADGFITITSMGKGIDAIHKVNKNHESLKFEQTLFLRDTISNSDEYVFPKIQESYFISDPVLPLFKAHNYKKAGIISPKDFRDIITQYVRENNLQDASNESMVNLNDTLRKCLRNEKSTQLQWKVLFDKLRSTMSSGMVMVFPTETVTIKTGKLPRIRMECVNRNNKVVTRVYGADVFRIDTKGLCRLIQQTIGCSCGLVQDKTGVSAVQSQGDQTARITKLLMEKYKVPNSFIDSPSKQGKK